MTDPAEALIEPRSRDIRGCWPAAESARQRLGLTTGPTALSGEFEQPLHDPGLEILGGAERCVVRLGP
jgi:hypothetical protein